MYTELKSYQIIIALFKKWGIRHCVLSAGSRNVPFVHSVEKDDFFKCYSVVDERSAGYFALGLAQQVQEPVVISCTSSTATCNYWPPVAEAFYQNVPIIVMTSDRNPAMLGQWEDQMIDQVGMFDRHVRKSVNLPSEINNQDDWIYCQRLVNEALLELNHHGTGPVHINIPMKSYNNSFNTKNLPVVTKIDRIELLSDDSVWKGKVEKLKSAKRILVTVGQRSFFSDKLNEGLTNFFKKFNSAISVDYMSNVECEGSFNATISMDTRYITVNKFKEFLPDIVISLGGNVFGGIKEMLLKYKGDFEHWSIMEEGRVLDMYKSLTTIFECPEDYFFEKICSLSGSSTNNQSYYNAISEYVGKVVYPDFEYGNIYAIKNVVEKIPSGSTLHLSINDSIRITNFFKLNSNVKVYANIGTHGIDGCMSSLIGQSVYTDKLCYLVIGDLAFFYDMNSLRIRHLGKNVRILLINNHGGEEFYFNHMWKDKYSDLHTTARHDTKAEGWVKENGFIYLSAHDKESYEKALPQFMQKESDKPIFFEVFSEMKTDADSIYDFFDESRPRDLQSEIIRNTKELIKKTIGEEKAKKIASSLGKKI